MTTDTVLEKSTKTVDKIRYPKKYKVVILNDDFTPAEFVMGLLIKVFKHTESAAHELTLKIHNEGSAVAGIYNYEIAEQKTAESTAISRANGFPLQITMSQE